MRQGGIVISQLENTPSPWNKFRKIYGSYRLYIKFKVVVETKQLSVKKLNPKRNTKLKPIKSLSDMGWETKKISEFLNGSSTKKLNKFHKLYFLN